jgi:hypothetical protein
MATLLRSVRVLSIVLWEGGLLFFAFVLAPTAFHVLPSKHLAGLVVGGTLIILHHIGMVCGGLFLATTLLLPGTRKLKGLQIALIALMLAVTAYLQYNVLPAMERDRVQAGGDIDAAPLSDPARVDFERLHPLSEKVEGITLFAGLGVVLLLAAEPSTPKTIDS